MVRGTIRRLGVLLANVTLLVALLVAPAGATAAGHNGLAWGACADPAAARYHATCATLAVPVDWSAPHGPALRLALLRIPATGTARGTVLGDSEDLGGLGGSQLDFFLQHGANYLARLPATHASRDIVLFDPRGRGGSDPLHCAVSAHFPAPSSFPTGPAGYAALVAHDRAVAAGCTNPLAAHLDAHLDLDSQARDVEALRAALGLPRVDWLGQATGAELGLVYAARYPSRAGRMVLDTPADPYRLSAARALDAAHAEETAFAHFTTWCATADCALSGRDGGAVFDRAVARADAGGVSGGALGRPLTGEEVRVAAGQFLLGYPVAWGGLAAAIADAADRGDGSGLADYVAITFADPDHTTNRAQTCVDSPAPAGYATLAALAGQARRIAPHLAGASLAWDAYAGCLDWPTRRLPLAATLPAHLHPATAPLVTATTGDPIDPYPWARDVAHRTAGARLLTAPVDGHGAFDNAPCAATAIDTYLSTGRLPTTPTCS